MPDSLPSDEIPPAPRRRFPWLRVILILLGVAVIGGVLVYVNLQSSAEEELAALLEELDRTEPGWGFGDIQEKRVEPREEENAALQVMMFKLALPKHDPALWQALEELDNLVPHVPLTEEQRGKLKQALDTLKHGIAAARKLNKYARGRYPIVYKKDVFTTLFPDTDGSSLAARVLWYDTLRRLELGDVKGALENVHGMLAAGASVGDEPTAGCQLLRMNIRKRTVRSLEHILARAVSDEPTLKALQDKLAAEEKENLLATWARGERALGHVFFQALAEGDASARWTAEQLLRNDAKNHERWEEASYLLGGATPRDHVAVLRRTTQLVRIAEGPLEQQMQLLDELDADSDAQPLLARQMLRKIAGRVGFVYLRNRAELRAAIAGLAAERFRLRHGRWPESLAELVPEFLREVPNDPFTGTPLLLKRTEHGLVIHSVGRDGKDDGGRLFRIDWTGGKLESEGVDFGFELWNAEKRRRE